MNKVINKNKYYSFEEVFNIIGKIFFQKSDMVSSKWQADDFLVNKFSNNKGHSDYLFKAFNPQDTYIESVYHFLLRLLADDFFDLLENYKKIEFPKNIIDKRIVCSRLFNGEFDITSHLIPRQQFNYFLKTGKKWSDKNENSNGVIKSSADAYIETLTIIDEEKIFVGDSKNLISYFELWEILKNKFQIEKWEVKFLVHSHRETLTPFKSNEVDNEGYATLYTDASNEKIKYLSTFYYKKQVEAFKPKVRFMKYQKLKEKWQNDIEIEEEEIIQILIKYLTFFDLLTLRLNTNLDTLKNIDNPLSEDLVGFFENDKLSAQEIIEKKRIFIKEAAFSDCYIEEIEKKYFNFTRIKNNSDRKAKVSKVEEESQYKNSNIISNSKKSDRTTKFREMAKQEKKNHRDANSMWEWLIKMTNNTDFKDRYSFIKFTTEEKDVISWRTYDSKSETGETMSKYHFINKVYKKL